MQWARGILLAIGLSVGSCTPKPQLTSRPAQQTTKTQPRHHPPPAHHLQDSQTLAQDLRATARLQSTCHTSAKNTSGKPGKNTDSSFVGIQGMKDALRNMPGSGNGNLNKFKVWTQAGQWEQFSPSHHHYDWWMFPIDRQTSGQGLKYTVHQDDIAALKADEAWLKDYRLGAILLMQSWGWDVAKKQLYPQPAPGQRWKGHGVRLGKLANSLLLFEQWDLYESLKGYVNTLRQQGVRLEDWILRHFPNA